MSIKSRYSHEILDRIFRYFMRIVFSAMMGENRKVAVLKLQDGKFEKGEWIPARTLNGDEQMMISFSDVPSCLYVELYKY